MMSYSIKENPGSILYYQVQDTDNLTDILSILCSTQVA